MRNIRNAGPDNEKQSQNRRKGNYSSGSHEEKHREREVT